MASLQSGNSNFVHIGLSSLSIGYVNACFQEQQQNHNKKKNDQSCFLLKITFPTFIFLPGFSFMNINESQDCRGKESAFFFLHYHFHPLHRLLDIGQEITAESSPLHIASSQTRTGNFGFQAEVANH